MTDIVKLIESHRAFFNAEKTFDVSYRRQALQNLEATIKKYESDIEKALYEDLGKSHLESYMSETGQILSELRYILKHLNNWVKDRRVHTTVLNFPARSFTLQEPYGVVLIIAPWNYPFLLSLEPLVGAIAAGNCCVLKLSGYSPASSVVIRKIIADAFDPGHISVVDNEPDGNTELLEQRFDYIFFTGSVAVGKQVMEKASKHLTPVTLELGGKSPAIVDRTSDLAVAARRIVFGKYLNCGQTCVAPDFLLADASVKDALLEHIKREIVLQYGSEPLRNKDYGKIINDQHFSRITRLIDHQKVVYGGKYDYEIRKIEPTVLDNVTADDEVMKIEIFGPVLPILTFKQLKEVEDYLLSQPKPLATYIFTRDSVTEHRLLNRLPFGGGCVNDTIMHLSTSEMGFGGVGNSGMGSYHGKKSFETFSHEKSIIKKYKWPDLTLRYQPYTSLKGKIFMALLSSRFSLAQKSQKKRGATLDSPTHTPKSQQNPAIWPLA
jgi:aldehyde dehydrogenase (NAD+)